MSSSFGCPSTPDDDDSPTLSGYGGPCADVWDCDYGLVCAGNGTCLEEGDPGTTREGEECLSNEHCLMGLVCSHDGLCVQTEASGTAGRAESCSGSDDCQYMMECVEGACYGMQIPVWTGVKCPAADSDTGPFRVYFEVPGTTPPDEFYRLPFPNDARIIDGKIDLSGHPSPGAASPEIGDVVGEILRTIETDLDGFGGNEAIIMRFSGKVDYNTINVQPPGANLYVVDITAGSREYATYSGVTYWSTETPGLYICTNWIALINNDGRPYLPGHTYAAVIGSSVKARGSGDPAAQDADFSAVLSSTAPSESRLQRAWEAYSPFRDFLAEAGIDANTVAGAAVFTIQDPRTDLLELRTAVRNSDPPGLEDLFLCQDGDPGPFVDADDETRGCQSTDEAFDEIQGTVSIPIFQEGTPPYKEVADGGALRRDENGAIDQDGAEDVTFALTLPRGVSMPAKGWPLVLYAHGTGENYRTFVENGTAALLSEVVLDDGTPVSFALLSIDAVLNGPRRHPENWKEEWLTFDPRSYDPEELFFNVLNPKATRDTPLQAAADYFQLVRVAETLAWTDEESPTGQAARFDLEHLYYMGHDQGAFTGVLFLAGEPLVKGAVLSGAGGLLIESMLNKTRPYDLPSAMKAVVADPDIDRYHPALNLFQALLERSDAVNYALHVLKSPLEESAPHHIFQTYGIDDGYVPDVTQYALVRGLRTEQITGGNEALPYVGELEPPVSGNIIVNSDELTGVVALYQAEAEQDAHFVAFDRADARRQLSHFLGTAVRNWIPTVVAP